MEDLYPSEFWSTLLVDSIPGTISTSKSQQFCHSIRIALGQNTGKHNCHRQRGIWGIREYKHRSFWLFLPPIFPKSWTWYKQQLLCRLLCTLKLYNTLYTLHLHLYFICLHTVQLYVWYLHQAVQYSFGCSSSKGRVLCTD